ncbi:iron-sulfur cluster assembly scaffold protein [Pikeienuella sp. HZG-20]|uniref:iron-sulfur cluster assembly scaffold protein n=1 Tax=Paludibacillus litoralis TaxID=3133267 RepID=UPI0030EB75A1
MAETDLIQLYTKRILALAANIPLTRPLEHADGAAKKRSPLCGSTVSVALRLKDGLISEFAQDVKACALGQASAAVLGGVVIGRSRAEIAAGRNALHAMLKADAPPPGAPFDGLEVLEPAKNYKNRHASILLAWEATLAAIDEAAARRAC